MSDYAYEGLRRVAYDGWCFVPVCEKCGRFVKADAALTFRCYPWSQWELVPSEEPNATCSRCGRTRMPSEGCI